MKKISVALLVCSTLLFSACSSDKKADTSDSTSQQKIESRKTEDSKKKKAAEEAEKKKQEEIAKKVSEADIAMKAAETNPTDETVEAAKKSVEAIPGGNNELQKRLEAITGKLNEIKQQVAVQQEQQQSVQDQPQTTNPDPNFIDADGNGFDDRSPFNDPAAREDNRRREAEAQQQYWDQYNQQQQQQNDAVAQVDQYQEDFKAQNGREPTSGEIQSQWLQEQGIE